MRLNGFEENAGPIRVLHAAETVIGGIGSYIDELVCLQNRHYGAESVRVVVPASQAGFLERVSAAQVIGFQEKQHRLANAIELAGRVYAETFNFSPHILHLHSSYAGLAVRPPMIFLHHKPKVVYCPHGWAFCRDSAGMLNAISARIEYALSYATDAIVCISHSEHDAAMGAGICRDRLQLICNGIDDDLQQADEGAINWPDNRLHLLFVGRFDRQKGIDVFLEAMRRLGNLAFAYVVGAPVVNGEALTAIPDNVTLVGWKSRAEVQAYYQSADLLVMPSRWEGFGLVAAEALRAGLPVIASRVGGLVDIVEDGVCGRLVAPESPTAIVDAVSSLDREMLRRMGQAGKARANSLFGSTRMFNEMDCLYTRLL
ncbi:Glycosyltransferase-like protein [Pelodictyon luteolum DSM 273]|uniref:Glycosyltransferase-like protein n=2 Tax=Pelodictyon luteolum TaxID=1100 RepID=Q3B4T3_CHLL3|nr:Glycosyltransferase-like protein [Pelodictyon luteolum DSM 273]